jgi:hypothetical protein
MAKGFEAPPGINIAALQQQNKAKAVMDLMRPGDGTPWEDRGARGAAVAFVQTCVRSITSPALLLDHIRRPDSAGEGAAFAAGCAVCWGLSAVVHGALLLNFVFTEERGYADVSGPTFMMVSAVVGAVVGALSYFLLVGLASRTYYALISTELKNTAPPVLIKNLFCYCMGPSILALLPIVGPPLALLFIYIDWCVAGARRLFVSWRGAIVAASLSFALVLIIAGIAGFVIRMIASGVIAVDPPAEGEDPTKPKVVR